MWILGLNRHHNASAALLHNGEIVFHLEEERLSRVKRDNIPYLALKKSLEYTDTIDKFVVCGFESPLDRVEKELDFYSTILSKELKKPVTVIDSWKNHHEMHASCAFYNSGFTDSLVIVVDGAGSYITDKREIESIYYCEYPARFKLLYKRLESDDYTSAGIMYEAVSEHLGFHKQDAGKVMGLSSYGTTPDIPLNVKNERYIGEPLHNFYDKADLAYSLQLSTQERVLGLIKHALSLHKCKNVCVTGGYGLNCVANYYYLDKLDNDVNLYCEPISSDSGTSIGAVKFLWHRFTNDKTIRKHHSIYYGSSYDINVDGDTVEYSDVIQKLIEGKVVAMYQGRSESGPRSLGNRTILFDATLPNGKNIVNKVKKREHFRPFAGTILKEHANEWFDMRGLEESPFMMYAVNCREEFAEMIPSIIHIDGTCRVQTVTKEQNEHFYNLIQEFYLQTGVPLLFNTSFNLAGEPLVETPEDAINTFTNSEIDCLYFPEKKKLICKL
jgi:carbamoyltransferase